MKDLDFKRKLIAMRNSIQDYLDAIDMAEVDEKGKTEKDKAEKAKSEKDKSEKEDKED